MRRATHKKQNVVLGTVIAALVFCGAGCGATRHHAEFDPAFYPNPNSVIRVGAITDEAHKGNRGNKEDLDLAQELRTELEKKLAKEGLLASAEVNAQTFVLSSQILDYDPGNAFGRWLWPGVGSTVLSVQSKLHEGDRQVGTIRAMRTVSWGGAYSIGQWKLVFGNVAADIIKELKAKLRPKMKK